MEVTEEPVKTIRFASTKPPPTVRFEAPPDTQPDTQPLEMGPRRVDHPEHDDRNILSREQDDRQGSYDDKGELVARVPPPARNATNKGSLIDQYDRYDYYDRDHYEVTDTAHVRLPDDGDGDIAHVKDDVTTQAPTSPTSTTSPAAETTTSPGHMEVPVEVFRSKTVTNNNTSRTLEGYVGPDDPVAPEAADSGSTSMTLVVAPLIVGVGLLIVAILFFVHYKRRSRSLKSRKNIARNPLPDFTDGLYSKADMAKKKRHSYVPDDEILLYELNMALPANGRYSGQRNQEKRPFIDPVFVLEAESVASSPNRDLSKDMEDLYGACATTLVDNELYETPPTESDLCNDILRTLALDGHGFRSLDNFEDIPTASNPSLQISDDGTYLIPCCHDHPEPGPHWKPFHDYDPVYVPHSDPSAMARRLDKAGYVTSKHQRQPNGTDPTDPYEDLQVYSDIDEEIEDSQDDQGATASLPPPLPPVMRPLPGVRPSQSNAQTTSAVRMRPPLPAPPSPSPTPAGPHAADPTTPTMRPNRRSNRHSRNSSRPQNIYYLLKADERESLNPTLACDMDTSALRDNVNSTEQQSQSEELYEPVTFPE